jgi:hypothetical protein
MFVLFRRTVTDPGSRARFVDTLPSPARLSSSGCGCRSSLPILILTRLQLCFSVAIWKHRRIVSIPCYCLIAACSAVNMRSLAYARLRTCTSYVYMGLIHLLSFVRDTTLSLKHACPLVPSAMYPVRRRYWSPTFRLSRSC